jgi:glycosyltransferase involved in cell wall biosynthesis
MTESRPELSIVLPCYNEAENLPPLLERYAQVWEDLPAELILVDNGSTDATEAVLRRELSRYPFARTVKVEKNQGYGHGIMTGLRAARGEFLAFSHADQQCKPDDVFAAYHKLKSAPKPEMALVKGRRARRSFQSELITGGMAALASVVLATPLWDINAQPKVFHHSHLARLKFPPDGFPLDLYVLYQARRAGVKILTVPVVFAARGHGQSKWAFSFLSRWRTILNMVSYIFRLRFGLTESPRGPRVPRIDRSHIDPWRTAQPV